MTELLERITKLTKDHPEWTIEFRWDDTVKALSVRLSWRRLDVPRLTFQTELPPFEIDDDHLIFHLERMEKGMLHAEAQRLREPLDTDTAVAAYRLAYAQRESAPTPADRETADAVLKRLRKAWSDWQGEDSLHSMAFGEPVE